MALTTQEEALVRQLLDQQAAILSLAGNEATITSKLGATKVTLADLVATSALADADLLLTRQGTTDKSVRADILAAYMAAELNLSSLAPKASPVFTGDPTAPTPAQFDNDVSLATTAFVQRAVGNLSGSVVFNSGGSPALTSADAGKVVILTGATNGVLYLPVLSTVPDGTSFLIKSEVSSYWSISTGGSDGTSIAYNGSSYSNIGPLELDSWLLIVKGVGLWRVYGIAAGFPRIFSATGYQRLPSGLIVQWGATGIKGGGTTTVIPFGLTFPNACLAVYLTPTTNGGGGQQNSKVTSPATTGFSYVNYSATTEECFYLAFGY